MIYLILDILFYSLTPLNTSFYLYYLTYNKDYLNILSLIIIIYLTHNLLYIPIFIIIYILKKYHYFNICNKFLQIIITYLIFYNIHININNFLCMGIIYIYLKSNILIATGKNSLNHPYQ